MAGKIDLLTGWITIGKAGKTIDGRTIDAEKLKQCAEDYDPELYTAVINNEHIYGNFGTVRKLRVGQHKDGSPTLEAILAPNMYMIFQNSDKRKLFTSMEIMDNFNDKERAYLVGLALTDQPASLGTTELHFSAKKNPHILKSAESEELSAESFKPQEPEDKSIKSQVLEALKCVPGFSQFFNKNEPKENEMTEEQMKKLLDSFSTSMKEIKESVEKLATQTPAGGENPEEGENKITLESLAASVKTIQESVEKLSKQNPAGSENPEEGENKITLESLQGNIDKLTTTLEAALKGKGGTPVPPGNGGGQEFSVI